MRERRRPGGRLVMVVVAAVAAIRRSRRRLGDVRARRVGAVLLCEREQLATEPVDRDVARSGTRPAGPTVAAGAAIGAEVHVVGGAARRPAGARSAAIARARIREHEVAELRTRGVVLDRDLAAVATIATIAAIAAGPFGGFQDRSWNAPIEAWRFTSAGSKWRSSGMFR